MENKFLTIGNITTIINSVGWIIAGLIIGVVTAFGLQLPIDQYSLSAIICAVITGLFSYINAKYHNTFWDKDEDYIKIPVSLDDAQIQAIENFIKYQTSNNIDDVDPASEYEEEL